MSTALNVRASPASGSSPCASGAISARNQGSIAVASWISSTGTPRANPAMISSKRSWAGVRSRSRSSASSSGAGGVTSSSRERIALANACLKVRPIAIASPTDCMWVERRPSAPGNFSNANRGHLTTT